jgi:hypothetical protein
MNFRYRLIFLLMFLALYSYSFSQPHIEWQKSLGGISDDRATSIQQTTDGGFIVAGYSNSSDGDVTNNHGGTNFWIIKLGPSGDIQWEKSIGGEDYNYAGTIQQTSDGGFILSGSTCKYYYTYSDKVEDCDCIILKLDSLGNIEWQKIFGGSYDDRAFSSSQINDGGYIVAGFSQSLDGNVSGNHSYLDYWIVRLDTAGYILWQKSLGGFFDDEAFSVQQTNDAGFIVAGFAESEDGDIIGNHGSFDYWIVKLSSAGILEWQKSLGGSGTEKAYSIQQTKDNGYIVTGYSDSDDGDVTDNHGRLDYWIVKLKSNGDIQWQKSLGGSLEDEAYSAFQSRDGGYIICGSSRSNNGDVTNHRGNNYNYDYWIVKLNGIGVIQWQKSFGGNDNDFAQSIKQTIDNGFIIVGYSNSNDADVSGHHGSSYSSDYWIVKLSPEITDIKDKTNHTNISLSISPNPASDNISISFPGGINPSIHIYNSLGIEIKRFDAKDLFDKNSINISLEGFPSGMYYVRQDIGCLAYIRCLTKSFVVIR